VNFEKALQELETIVAKLESGEVTLEEALSCYAEGVRILAWCESSLTHAEQKVEILLKDEQKPFRPVSNDENI